MIGVLTTARKESIMEVLGMGGEEMETRPVWLTKEEIMYLEATLHMVKGTGLPIGLKEGVDLAQELLDKIEQLF